MIFRILAFVFAFFVFTAPASAQFAFSDADKADLDRISVYLNALHTLKAGFLQIDPSGDIEEGLVYIDKPGRMRFEYHAPNPVLIVSDGSIVAIANRKLGTVDHYPLWTTPLSLILSNNINLARNAAITGIERQTGEIIVHAASHSSRINGNITLVFAAPSLELRQWTVVDAQGLTTTISLRDAQQGVAIDPGLFVLPTAK
jgi:outer membrane lipoprotein-sorting protein